MKMFRAVRVVLFLILFGTLPAFTASGEAPRQEMSLEQILNDADFKGLPEKEKSKVLKEMFFSPGQLPVCVCSNMVPVSSRKFPNATPRAKMIYGAEIAYCRCGPLHCAVTLALSGPGVESKLACPSVKK